ncbi:hypothetical protein WMF28_16475 [Sorangium sp. So ce590]
MRLAFHGPLTEADRSRLHTVVARCPIHKLMTTADVAIVTAPIKGSSGANVDSDEP